MAKVIYCKDTGVCCEWIVGGECPWMGRASTEDELLVKVKEHAQKDHDMPELAPEMVAKVKVVITEE